jgi:hypothetical protein
MRLSEWQARIEITCPILKSVKLIAMPKKIKNIPPVQFPCAFVMPLASKSLPNAIANGHKQLTSKSIGIFVAAYDAGDFAAGAVAAEQLELIEEQLKDGLSGWILSREYNAVDHVFSAVVADDEKNPFVLWQHVFSISYVRPSK